MTYLVIMLIKTKKMKNKTLHFFSFNFYQIINNINVLLFMQVTHINYIIIFISMFYYGDSFLSDMHGKI